MNKTRLKELYNSGIKAELKEKLQLNNVMNVPQLKKVVLNIGVKEAVADSKVLQSAMKVLSDISGQQPVKTLARKSIAGFKIREGMAIGTMVTLRGAKAYDFVDRLINLALPKVRDFQGVPLKLDGRGSYNLGLKDTSVFPEAESSGVQEKQFGLNITIHMNALSDDHARELLRSFGMPFRKK